MIEKNNDQMVSLYHLPPNINCRRETVHPEKLLNPQRLDIAAKYLYLSYKDKCKDWAERVYLEHIRAMTKNSFVEPYSEKNSAQTFIESFNSLNDLMLEKGYSEQLSPVPVDKNYRIMDGAHRVAICLKYNIDIPICVYPIDADHDVYDQAFFENSGMESSILDEIIFAYIQLSQKCACINIWPSAEGKDDELWGIISKEFKVIYKKNIPLNENGAFYYLAQIYKEYSWAQNSDDGFSGVYRKLMPCFPNFNPVRAVFVEVEDYDKLVEIKEKMRQLFALEKHSLHMTDNKEETLEMSEILLSDNSIHFMNQCNALEYKNTFKLLEGAKGIMDKGTVCFTGSVVLALYGIRQANDLDYISYDDSDKESHNDLLQYYGLEKNDILYRRDLHFVFFGIPFLTIDRVRAFKANRKEGKDLDDIKLIQMIQMNQGKSRKAELIRYKRRVVAKLQGTIIRFAHATGTYELLRKIYQIIK